MINEKQLITFIKNNGPCDFKQIVTHFRIKFFDNQKVSKMIFDLVKKAQIFINKDRKYLVPKKIEKANGHIRVHEKGFAFIDLLDKSIFISAINRQQALNGDEVEIVYYQDTYRKDAYQGFVTKINKRQVQKVVGFVVKKELENWQIIPLKGKKYADFFVNNYQDWKNKIKPKTIVYSNVVKYGKHKCFVDIVEILGVENDQNIDIEIIIKEANPRITFSPDSIKEAESLPSIANGDTTKKDLTDRLIITIDGDDTKDFDDAIEIYKNNDGNYVLDVHIADVSHYVKEDSPLDQEAQLRGTSIYLVDRIIPMLPKQLSEGICSLKPNKNRYAITIQMIIDNNGKNISSNVFSSIIKSKYRLKYSQVNNFLANPKKREWDDPSLDKMLLLAKELSFKIREQKIQDGYIDFEIDEAKVILDENGKTKNIKINQRGLSEMMIEDFMVRTNEVIANTMQINKFPSIYRTHAGPTDDALLNLKNILKALNIEDVMIPIGKKMNPKKFLLIFKKIKENRFDDFIKILMLRTLSKAIYSDHNLGHFGLASTSYTHFTSPIRRYPDLIVHRIIKNLLLRKNDNQLKKIQHYQKILPGICEQTTISEQKAMDLERKILDLKKSQFLEDSLGKIFKGTIVSVLKFGFFVELDDTKINGLFHISNLLDPKFIFQDKILTISNGTTSFTIGDKIDVVVLGVEHFLGKVSFCLAKDYIEISNNLKK